MPPSETKNDTDFRLGIKRARGELTQPELAERTGLSRRTIANLETTVRDPRFSTVVKVARGTGVSLDRIASHEPSDVATQVAALRDELRASTTALDSRLDALHDRVVDDVVTELRASIRSVLVLGAPPSLPQERDPKAP